MVTLVVCIRKKHGLSTEAFQKHWREVHGPLVRSVPEFMRHVRKYIQYHVISAEDMSQKTVGHAADYDGIAALTFDSPEAIETAFSEPRYLELIRPDEGNFIDPDKCLTWMTNELVFAG
jgi:uncharacterized protein (TIGR02118 family)